MKYVTVYKDADFSNDWAICSWHTTLKGAMKTAKECEAESGCKHKIWEIKVHEIKRGK